MYPALTIGPNWHFFQRPLYLLLALVLLLTGLSFGWLAIILRRGVKSHAQAPHISRTALTLTPLLQSKAGRIGKGIGLVVLGAFLGWLWRDHQIVADRFNYSRVYAVWHARNQQWERLYGSQIAQTEHK